jgi:hypothetical protein
VAAVWKGTVTMTDETEHVGVKCEDTGEGTVGPGAAGTDTKWVLTKCAKTEGTCETPTLEAVDLSWATKLEVSEGTLRDTITANGKGAPGFKWVCKVLGFKIENKCTGTMSTVTKNVSTGVEVTFTGKTLLCNLSGGVGRVEGTQLIEASAGGKLEAIKAGTFTKLTSSLGVQPTGETTITDTKWLGGGFGVGCKHVTMEGTIEAGGNGTIKSYVVTECHKIGCESIGEVSAIHLPWKTELYTSGGGIRKRIVSGGSGTPEWRFICRVLGSNYEDVCGLNTSAEMLNHPLEGDVVAKFDENSNKVGCSLGGAEAGTWQGEITIPSPGSVGGIEVK